MRDEDAGLKGGRDYSFMWATQHLGLNSKAYYFNVHSCSKRINWELSGASQNKTVRKSDLSTPERGLNR